MLNANINEWINPQNVFFLQKEGKPYFDKKTGEWKEQYGYKITSRIVREKGIEHHDFKRIAYSAKEPYYYNHFVIDADSGASTITRKCKKLFASLGISPLYIVGTDNPKKPHDSASIIIFFKPVERTDQTRELFNQTIHLFNLYSGGDLLNVGYQHKNPWLDYVCVSWYNNEPQKKENLHTLNHIFAQSCKFWKIQPNQVDDTFTTKRKINYDHRLIAKLGETNPEPGKVKAYWNQSSKLPHLLPHVQPYLTYKPLDEWIVIHRLFKFYMHETIYSFDVDAIEHYFSKIHETEHLACSQHNIDRNTFLHEVKHRNVTDFKNVFAITEPYLKYLDFCQEDITLMLETRNRYAQKPRKHKTDAKRADFGKKHTFAADAANQNKKGVKYAMKPIERKPRCDSGTRHTTQKEHTYTYNNATHTKSQLIKLLHLENEKNLSRKFKTLGIARQKHQPPNV